MDQPVATFSLDDLGGRRVVSLDDHREPMKRPPASSTLLQGTLDLLVLHALRRGPMHGYAVAQAIHLLSDQVLKVEEGSLYPALYRLELDGAVASSWGTSENNRRAKYYEITKRGRKLLDEQQQSWDRLAAGVHRVLAR
jgi:PadR family transcriptional regulator PadR